MAVRAVQLASVNADVAFDQVYPLWAQRLSRWRWTPVEVASTAAVLLTMNRPDGLYLDVGSGVGKFCLVAALAARGRFLGIERRADCVEVATDAARNLELGGRCEFVAGDAFAFNWSAFDGVYLFNPFVEALYTPAELEAGWPTLAEAVAATRQHLLQLSRGARVVTYCGFGGPFPFGFDRLDSIRHRGADLELWVRT
jgi:SAM-dependent methyltransferase